MRHHFGKLVALAAISLAAIYAAPKAQAQTQAQIYAAVNAALQPGGGAALTSFLAQYPNALQAVGGVVAGALDAGQAGSENLAAALVATGNASLISGVMAATGVNGTAQAAVANALAAPGVSPTVQIAVVESLQNAGATGAMQALRTAAAAAPQSTLNASITAGVQQVTLNQSYNQLVALSGGVVIPLPSPAVITAGSHS